MESVTSLAWMEDDARITIVSSTQIPHIVRRVVGQALDIPWSCVRVIKPFVGGGFGNKQDVLEEPMAAFLTSKLGGIPVKVSLSREECFLATRTRHAFTIDGKMGVNHDGTLKGYSLDVCPTRVLMPLTAIPLLPQVVTKSRIFILVAPTLTAQRPAIPIYPRLAQCVVMAHHKSFLPSNQCWMTPLPR